MEINLDINIDSEKTLTKKLSDVFRIAVEKCGMEWERATKQVISDNSVDTGEWLNSVHYKVEQHGDTYTMTGRDAVKYGVYIDLGTVEHFVPFYKYLGNGNYDTSQPILADWARRVLGMTEEEMLKMGGMKVKHSGIHSFEKGLIHLQNIYKKVFTDTFRENMK